MSPMRYGEPMKGFPFVLLFVVLAIVFLPAPAPADPLWTRVLAGEIEAGPIASGERAYLAGTDRTVTCVSEAGSFLWSKPIPGRVSPFMSVLRSGIVVAASGSGSVSALSADGLFLWRASCGERPVASPYEGRDGRIFLVYANSVACLTQTARVKWTLNLRDEATAMVSETGSGDLLVLLSSNAVLRISPFGQELSRIALDERPQAILPVAQGFVCGFPSGRIVAYYVRDGMTGPGRNGMEAVWESRGQGAVVALGLGEGTLCALTAEGRVRGLNETDGAFLWQRDIGRPAGSGGSVSWEYGQFNVAMRGYACAKTRDGRDVWDLDAGAAAGIPVISKSGVAYVATGTQALAAYRAEMRVRGEKKERKAENYGILNGSSDEYGTPLTEDRVLVSAFLSSVSADIESGATGIDEVSYSRRLAEIVRNRSGPVTGSRDFDATERARAASLLGKLGSEEARGVLIEASARERDTTVLVGILYGLASLGPDPEGRALEAIARVARDSGIGNLTVNRASCDALYAIIRYTGGNVAREGVSLLGRFAQSPYGNLDREYARRIMEKILE
jgi:outer membrane protein assembly factor BamB